MKLHGELISTSALAISDRRQMLALMQEHYQNVSEDQFLSDLAEKQWVIHVRSPTGELCGFSTQMVLELNFGGAPVKALFSGDTIIHREYWGDPELARVGGQLALSLADQACGIELYWFLISQGYRTYRFLPVFFRDFYPRFDQRTPPRQQEILNALARYKYPDRFEVRSGLVRPTSDQYSLRSGIGDLTSERLRDPHIQYFANRNPEFTRGYELCCLAELSAANLSAAARRLLRHQVA